MTFFKCWFVSSALIALFATSGASQQKEATIWKHDNAWKLWLSRDGALLLSQNFSREPEHQIRIWNVAAKRLVGDLPLSRGQGGGIVAIADDGQCLIVRRWPDGANHAADAELVRFESWTLGAGGANAKLAWKIATRHPKKLIAAAFQKTNVLLLLTDRIETRDSDGRLLHTVAFKVDMIDNGFEDGALSTDGSLAVLNDSERNLVFIDTTTGKVRRKLKSPGANFPPGIPRGFEFSIDGRFLICATDEVPYIGLNQDIQPQSYRDRWAFDAKSGKELAHWENTGSFRPTFSPDSHAVSRQITDWDLTVAEPRLKSNVLRFENIAKNRPTKFQLPQPWGKDDKRWLTDVRVSDDGKVVAALDGEGNIWVQNDKG